MAVEDGIPVKIIEKDIARCRQLDYDLPPAEIYCGDGTDISVLEEENVFSSSAIATTTGSDETNVLVSLYIKNHAAEAKVITKIEKSDFEEMIYKLEMGNVFNPKYITADRIITYVRAMQESVGNEVQSVCHVIDNKVEVLEFKIEEMAPNLNMPLSSVKFKNDLLLASITRDGKSFIPGGNDFVQVGDTVLVVTTERGISRFREIFA